MLFVYRKTTYNDKPETIKRCNINNILNNLRSKKVQVFRKQNKN